MKTSARLFITFCLMLFPFLAPITAVAQDGGEEAPNPVFQAFPDRDAVEGWNWPVGVPLNLAVDHPQTGESPDIELEVYAGPTPWDPESWWVQHSFGGEFDLLPGDVVTLSDGSTTRSHVVENLSITRIMLDEEAVTGLADPGKLVYVWQHETGVTVQAETSKKGRWEANFSGLDDLAAGKTIRAEIPDAQGNATALDWYMASPRFTVFPQWEWFDAMDWPDGALLSLSVNDKPECAIQRESSGNFINGNFGEGCDVAFGDEVIFSDGILSREHVVRYIAVTGFDLDGEVVYGKADPFAPVALWLNDDWSRRFTAVADETGSWFVSVAGVFDLNPGSSGMAESADPDGHATWIDWNVPNPRIVANLDENFVLLLAFPSGGTANITILDQDGTSVLWSAGQIQLDGSGNRWVDGSEHLVDLLPGMAIVASDGVYTRTLVLETLTFDTLDLTSATAQGSASQPFGREVWVGIGLPGGDMRSALANTDGAGSWFAELGEPVPDNFEWAAAQIFDEDGDSSEVRPGRVVALWGAVFIKDFPAGFWSAGEHSYQIGSGNVKTIPVSWDAPIYDGSVLLRPGGQFTWNGAGCTREDPLTLHPDQQTRFHVVELIGPATRAEFESSLAELTSTVVIDGGAPEPMVLLTTRLHNWDTYVDEFCSEIFQPENRAVKSGSIVMDWDAYNPEEVNHLSWKGSPNLVGHCPNPTCTGDFEFFGNSWVLENEGTEYANFIGIVAGGSSGSWARAGDTVQIASILEGEAWLAGFPVQTSYRFDPAYPDRVQVDRGFEIGPEAFPHAFRPFIPRLDRAAFPQVIYPTGEGTALWDATGSDCDFGCLAAGWTGGWFAMHNPATGEGMLVMRAENGMGPSLWLDKDDASWTNASAFLLNPPEGGFRGTLTETEYICFYDSSTWTPGAGLPGCAP